MCIPGTSLQMHCLGEKQTESDTDIADNVIILSQNPSDYEFCSELALMNVIIHLHHSSILQTDTVKEFDIISEFAELKLANRSYLDSYHELDSGFIIQRILPLV